MTLILIPFGAASTVADVVAGVDLTGRRIVVTGGASGIGVRTARNPEAAEQPWPVSERPWRPGTRGVRHTRSQPGVPSRHS